MKNYFLKSALPFTIFLLLTFCVSYTGNAQTKDSLLRVYNNETIHSFGKVYVKGSKQLKFGDLKPEFNGSITKRPLQKVQRKFNPWQALNSNRCCGTRYKCHC